MAIHSPGRLVEQWQELEDSGTPLEPFKLRVGATVNGGLTIRYQPYSYDYGFIRVRKSGRVSYELPVFIRRDEPGRTIIREVTLDVPWDDSIEWLEEDTKRNKGWYTFSEVRYPPQHDYPRCMVLNHRMACSLSQGSIREGVLLAVGKVRPPDSYRDGDMIPVTLRLLDQWDCQLAATIKLPLERCFTLGKASTEPRREPLHSRRDIISPARSLVAPPCPTKGSGKKDAEGVHKPFEGVHRVDSKTKDMRVSDPHHVLA